MSEVKTVKVTETQKAFWKGYVKITGGLTLWEKVGKSAEALIRVALSKNAKVRIFEVYNPVDETWDFAHTSKGVYGTEENYDLNEEVGANVAKFSAIDRPLSVVEAYCKNHPHGVKMLENWQVGRTLIDGVIPHRIVIASSE